LINQEAINLVLGTSFGGFRPNKIKNGFEGLLGLPLGLCPQGNIPSYSFGDGREFMFPSCLPLLAKMIMRAIIGVKGSHWA